MIECCTGYFAFSRSRLLVNCTSCPKCEKATFEAKQSFQDVEVVSVRCIYWLCHDWGEDTGLIKVIAIYHLVRWDRQGGFIAVWLNWVNHYLAYENTAFIRIHFCYTVGHRGWVKSVDFMGWMKNDNEMIKLLMIHEMTEYENISLWY